MLSKIAWTCDLLTLCASAIFVTSSDVFTSRFPEESSGRSLSHGVVITPPGAEAVWQF